MCDDHGLSRRAFLGGTAAILTPALLRYRAGRPSPVPRRLPLRSPLRAQNASGSAYSMAMHIHSSFSEKDGSMDGQLAQAAANKVDVLWWTDHDQRMMGLDYRDVVHFTSLDGEKPAPGQGGVWKWQPGKSGSLASYGGGVVSSPSSPNDTVAGGSLRVQAKSSSGTAAYGFSAQAPSFDFHDNLTGQSVLIDVLCDPSWSGSGHLEVLVTSSWHPAAGGRPAGNYHLSYRIAPTIPAPAAAQGLLGIVHLKASKKEWTTLTLNPAEDIAKLWPDMDSRDFGFWNLTLSAVSQGGQVEGYFDYLRFDRTVSGELALQQQASMMQALASRYPGVQQEQGLEISLNSALTHCNWFGPGVQILPYQDMDGAAWHKWLAGTAIPQIHSSGGLASYNHPFGVGRQPLKSQAKQDAALKTVAASLLGTRALGADLLEAGYVKRGGMDLAHHAGVWDVMSRNGVFLTGTGVSDDHEGQDWLHGSQDQGNNWATSAWAASNGQADLLAALAAGQAWCGSLSEFGSGAALDLSADGTCPMGSVSLSSLTSRQVTLTCTGLPAGGYVQVVQGTVDYAGTSDPSPSTEVVAAYTPDQLDGSGQATLPLDTTDECFARVQVADSTGTVVALSNPVWLLRNEPPDGIPGPRQV